MRVVQCIVQGRLQTYSILLLVHAGIFPSKHVNVEWHQTLLNFDSHGRKCKEKEHREPKRSKVGESVVAIHRKVKYYLMNRCALHHHSTPTEVLLHNTSHT